MPASAACINELHEGGRYHTYHTALCKQELLSPARLLRIQHDDAALMEQFSKASQFAACGFPVCCLRHSHPRGGGAPCRARAELRQACSSVPKVSSSNAAVSAAALTAWDAAAADCRDAAGMGRQCARVPSSSTPKRTAKPGKLRLRCTAWRRPAIAGVPQLMAVPRGGYSSLKLFTS